MKKRIFIGMLALVLLILPVSLYLQINQAFRQSLDSARNSALREESAIARALSMELQRNDDRAGSDTTLRRIAYEAQRKYGSANVRVILYSGRNQLNGQMPVTAPEILLEAEERSTYLSSMDHNMYIVHPLDAEITLITVTDFSPFYEARAEQTRSRDSTSETYSEICSEADSAEEDSAASEASPISSGAAGEVPQTAL